MHSHITKPTPDPHTHNVSTHTLSGLWDIFLKGTFALLPLIFNSNDAIIVRVSHTERLQAPVTVLFCLSYLIPTVHKKPERRYHGLISQVCFQSPIQAHSLLQSQFPPFPELELLNL